MWRHVCCAAPTARARQGRGDRRRHRLRLPRAIRTSAAELAPGDAVAFATDGVAPGFSAVRDPALSAQAQAERILREDGKGIDDALAVVVRWRP